MKVRFWGVRGSFAMPGPEFLRYGGNTTCVEVLSSAGKRLLIDLGTGATALGRELMQAEFGRGAGILPILLSHTHLDHIQGLPFFTPFFIKGNQIRILGAQWDGVPLEQTLQNQLNPHYSPLYGLENLAAGVSVETILPGSRPAVDGFDVRVAALPHGGTQVLGFRVSADGRSLAFLSDVEYTAAGATSDALALAAGADLVVHDAMFSDEEYVQRRGWGHSAVSHAIALAERARARKLALFHHSPDATDGQIDELVAAARQKTDVPLIAAAEGPGIEV